LSVVAAWRAIGKHWILVVLTTFVGALALVFYSMGQTKIYVARVTLQIDPRPPSPLGNNVQSVVDVGSGTYWSNQEYYKTQFKIIASQTVAGATARKLALQNDPNFIAQRPVGQLPANTAPVSVETAAQILRSRLKVEPERDSRLVVVSLEDADPQRAQRIVSALADVYIERNVENVVESTSSAMDWLGAQLDKLKGELLKSELALYGYKRENGISSVSIDDQSSIIGGELRQLNSVVTDLRAKIEKLKSRVGALRKIDPENPAGLPAAELAANTLLAQLRQDYVSVQRDYEGIEASGKGANHPEMLSIAARKELVRKALLTEVRGIQDSADRELNAAFAEAKGVAGLLEDGKRRAMDLSRVEIDYRRLERSKNNTEKLYSLVLERTKETDLTRLLRFNNIRVVDPALLPKGPVRPKTALNTALGAFGGLLVGLALAFLRETFDRTLKSPDDLERETGFAFLGLLPLFETIAVGGRRRRAGARPEAPHELLVHEQPTSRLAEAARAIRTNVLFMSPDRQQRRILVTSAASGDGKTTVACCLAIAMAQAGHRVLILDCDLRRPRMHRIFGKSNDVGVTSVLLDRTLLTPETWGTAVPGLSVLPSGPLAPNPAELVQSDRFASLLTELDKHFDRIVIDSPPIVPVTDAAILSKCVDGTILVARAFTSSRDLVSHAARLLRDVGGPILGTVLNAVDPDRRTEYYYYGGDRRYNSSYASHQDA